MDDTIRELLVIGIVNHITSNDRIANATDVMNYMSDPNNDLNRIATIVDKGFKMKVIECSACHKQFVACNCKIILDIEDATKNYCVGCGLHMPRIRKRIIDIEKLFK